MRKETDYRKLENELDKIIIAEINTRFGRNRKRPNPYVVNHTIEKKNREIELLKNKIKAEDKKIRDLTNQIKGLKEVDLGIEEKKRKILPENGH